MSKQRLAIFASGTGSNALNIINYFDGHERIDICFVLSNKEDAPIVNSARKLNIPVKVYSNDQVSNGDYLTQVCQSEKIDWIVLAGYLRLIPTAFIKAYPSRIINLHPSLLPKYGGKGMFGDHVHRSVLANKELESGITIHFVNNKFDEGEIISQFRFAIEPTDELSQIQNKIRALEQEHLPRVVENTVL